ncbi:hypothetical protein K7X08_033615 [Anisodus acutangulus]|uniref:Uncharacterized protein n=1 Tax=Anisodus acutangulus TaxID=402998 RepID=A0A9Q1M5B0_9SOLA|nr:hypothetical protein K7X08_033615 [Anisodus acutangulus]
MNVIVGSPLSDPANVHNGDGNVVVGSPLSDPAIPNSDGSSNPLLHVDDHNCNVVARSPLSDSANVLNIDGSSNSLPDHVTGEVADFAVASEDRSPDGRINDVLSEITGEVGNEEVRDVGQNGYETANKEVI